MIKYKAQLCLPIEFLMTCLMAGNECRKVNVTLDTQSNTSICSTWCATAVQVLFFRENNLSQGEEPLPNIILISMPPSSPSWSIWSSINRLFGWGHHKHDSDSSSSRFNKNRCLYVRSLYFVSHFLRSPLDKPQNDLDCSALPNLLLGLHLSINIVSRHGLEWDVDDYWGDYLSDDGNLFRNYSFHCARKKCLCSFGTQQI